MKPAILNNRLARLHWAFALTAAMGLAACGGGGSDGEPLSPPAPAPAPTPAPAPAPTPAPSPAPAPAPEPEATILGGTAAVGAPIAGGTVVVTCAAGGPALNATTSAAGDWQVVTTGYSLPCAARVTGGSLAAGSAYHSVAISFGTLNITPLTDLIVANLAGKDPSQWWGASGPAGLSDITAAGVDKALAALRTAFNLPELLTFDPHTTAFTATAGNVVDDILEALQLALSNLHIDYAALLADAVGINFNVPDNFRNTLQGAYVTITGGGSGVGGSYTLTLDVSVMGTTNQIVLQNMPKPANQQEFCGEVVNQSFSQITQGGAGTLTINSCSFSGNTGQVSATMAVTSPMAMTVPYTVTYTYH